MAIQEELAIELPRRQETPMGLLSIALQNNAAIDVIERLAALQERSLAKQAEGEFNRELTAAQNEIPRVVPDINNPNAKKKYSSYEALDKAIRPVYLRHGFSLSFSTADCPNPEKVRTVCRCSKEHHTVFYQIDITSDGSGPKGGGMLTRPHADLAANSLGMRRLLRMIFNIVDTPEDELLTNGELIESLEYLANCRNPDELQEQFKLARGGIEIKAPKLETHLGYLLADEVPEDYQPQMLWQMACCEWDYVEFMSYHPDLREPYDLFVKRFERDEKLISGMELEVEQFLSEVERMHKELLARHSRGVAA